VGKGSDGSSADEPLLGEAVLDVLRAARRTRLRPAPGPSRLSMPQLVMLDAIARVGALGVSAVAAEAGLSQPTVSRALPALERAGLVERRPDDGDGRASLLALTPGGQALVAETREWLNARLAKLWAALSADEQRAAPGLLAKLVGFIDELR
jgi:DNA-binding MarR family transcriptional regulator